MNNLLPQVIEVFLACKRALRLPSSALGPSAGHCCALVWGGQLAWRESWKRHHTHAGFISFLSLPQAQQRADMLS